MNVRVPALLSLLPSALLPLVLMGCPHEVAPPAVVVEAPPAPAARANPLLQPSTLAFSLPAFDQIRDEDYRPAFAAGIAEQRAEVDAIAANPAAPTFENTLVALERSGQTLTRVERVFFSINSSFTNDTLQQVEGEVAPLLSAHDDATKMNAALFKRIDTVYQQESLGSGSGGLGSGGLDPESAQLLARYHASFLRAGAMLNDSDKAALQKINGELSSLTTEFAQKVRRAMSDGGVVVDNVAELDGLSPGEISAAAEAATARGLTGKWVLALQNTTVQPALGALKNRALRERIFNASVNRATTGDVDTTGIVVRLAELRAQKARLLGYPNFAAWALEDETAGKPAAVNAILAQLAPAALTKAKSEAADLQKIIDKQAKVSKTAPFALQPWDWAFYAEQDRKARFDFDEAQVKPYFELEHVIKDGVFYAATQLYGITFVERTDLPKYDDSVRIFEVREADGSVVGMILLDFFQRKNKQGGAWMENYVDQSTLLGTKPVVVNNLNIPSVAAGQPVLLSFDEVTTMFHEFGHGLHGLFANSKYPLLSGTNTPRDFVEYPSQFNEMWASEPAVLANYAKRYDTGEAMPKALFEKVIAAQNFGGGYGTLEYLKAAKVDIVWHELGVGQAPAASGVKDFEAAALKAAGMDYAPVPPRYHSTYFNHVFGGGYESAYYAYIWSEVLARDTGAWFHAHGGLTRANGDAYRAQILSQGRTREPAVLFKSFYGKDPEVGPLLEYRGLVPTAKTK